MKFEADIIEFFQNNTSIGFIKLFQFLTLLGGLLGALIVFFILFFKKRSLSYAFLITFIIASIFNKVLKAIIMRDRPFEVYDYIENYGNEGGYSMPSGHSLSAAIFASFIFYLIIISSRQKSTKILGGISCFLFVVLIALSRMVLGVHFLTDTLAGIIVGILFAIIGIIIYNYIIRKLRLNIKRSKE